MKFSIKKTKLIDGDHVIDVNIHPNTRPGVRPIKTIFSFNTQNEALDFFEDLKAVISKHCPHETIKDFDEIPVDR